MRDDRELHGNESARDNDDDAIQIRYSLTALGEAHLEQRRGKRFRGFGPCSLRGWPAAS
jgi:hypothetical protein